jgi:hypothetical protein
MTGREIVDAFVAHLRDHGHPDLHVDRRPDDDNRGSPDIDAIAGPFAIEHTSIDTLPNQRRDADWFMRAAGNLEQELPAAPASRLSITLQYDAIGLGQNWLAVRAALRNWLSDEAPRLPEGRSIVEASPRIPFRLHIFKASNRPAGVFFARFEPEDNTLPAQVRAAFDRKAQKLAKYQAPGVTTILLVENNDLALMNEVKMFEAIRSAFPTELPSGVDQVWYADSCLPEQVEFRDFTPGLLKSAV